MHCLMYTAVRSDSCAALLPHRTAIGLHAAAVLPSALLQYTALRLGAPAAAARGRRGTATAQRCCVPAWRYFLLFEDAHFA